MHRRRIQTSFEFHGLYRYVMYSFKELHTCGVPVETAWAAASATAKATPARFLTAVAQTTFPCFAATLVHSSGPCPLLAGRLPRLDSVDTDIASSRPQAGSRAVSRASRKYAVLAWGYWRQQSGTVPGAFPDTACYRNLTSPSRRGPFKFARCR